MLNSVTLAINLFSKGVADMFGTDDDEERGFYPERRLWCAVVISTIEEYTEWLGRIQNAWSLSQKPVDSGFKFSLQHIRRQCKTEWFESVCGMADISADVVAKKFDQLDKEYCLKQIPFQDEPERFLSQWALRKISKQKIAN